MQPNSRFGGPVGMTLKSVFCTAVIWLALFSALGQSVVMNLDNIPEDIQCDDTWTEQNLNLSFVSTTPDDCVAGSCFFEANGPVPGIAASVVLYPSRLSIDLSTLQNIELVEVDIVDVCGFYCTQAVLMDNAGIVSIKGNSLTQVAETLVMDNPTEAALTELAISSCEGGVNEIRIYQSTSSIDPAGFSHKSVLRTLDCFGREVDGPMNQILFYIYDDGSVEKKVVIE